MADFNGRPVLVTGAAGGIGRAIVRQLVRAGADVIASDRTAASLAELQARGDVRVLPFDLRSEDSVREAVTDLDVWGLVNCAGWGGRVEPVTEADLGVFDQVVAINTRGALLVIKYAAAAMIRSGVGGAIVNVSSQAALVALPGHVSYGASKAALDSITRVSALELGRHGIRVNSVNPTVVMTPMSAPYWGQPHIRDPFLAMMPLGRWATEDEIAAPVVFLLSDAAAMISGVTLPVDGGYTCR
jgi:NAD(P)-dependent dehydrogenase (short-subunit alcohol dehydrogenase family)